MQKQNSNYVFFSDADIDAIDVSPEDNFFTPALREALGLIDQPREVCDVGCGNGVFTVGLKKQLQAHRSGW
jgi:2-polyprenyl-3-methyl-5-hydroxy-6-metoxy-1,4-benzoquinol methylase